MQEVNVTSFVLHLLPVALHCIELINAEKCHKMDGLKPERNKRERVNFREIERYSLWFMKNIRARNKPHKNYTRASSREYNSNSFNRTKIQTCS